MPQQTILIVDDSPVNLTVLGELLRQSYKVRAANSGARALELASLLPLPDLILLDVMMPRMSGYEVLEQLRANPQTRDIPVIFTTAMTATEDEQRGLELGAVDYIAKPLRPAIVLARVATHLELKRAREQLQAEKASLQTQVARQQRENSVIQEVSIRAMARLAEKRDNETGAHILRTQRYVETLAQLASKRPEFATELDDRTIALIAQSAPLHDIGKVGVPDRILLKPGKLTPEEWVDMKRHAEYGADAIAKAVKDTHENVPFLRFAEEIALRHHERWDGSGYPGGAAQGMVGNAIPLSARLMAIADVFDALISRRVYKDPIPFEQVREMMAEQRGRHFDPILLDLFIANYPDFCEIALKHPDTELATAP